MVVKGESMQCVAFPTYVPNTTQLIRQSLSSNVSDQDLRAAKSLEKIRPLALREFDQIPMRSHHLLQQVKLIAPFLAGQSVVFMGDHDSTSLLIGLLGARGRIPLPSHMLLLDFDERLLVVAENFARRAGFGDLLECRLYNVFDPVPSDLIGRFDWFYTNPPYGCRNNGESARLFITRCCELARQDNSHGCIILPDDPQRLWTRASMLTTQRFLCNSGWTVGEKINKFHQYHLDDDSELSSSMLIVESNELIRLVPNPMPYVGRKVDFGEIENFYGYSVSPPYPHYIRYDNRFDYNWSVL